MIYNEPFFFYTTERKKIKKQSFRFERNKNDKYKMLAEFINKKISFKRNTFAFEEIF